MLPDRTADRGNCSPRRQSSRLERTSGTRRPQRPIRCAPDGWNAEQIHQYQEWFDSILAGNTGSRTRLLWGPSGVKYQAFKEAPYKDDFDEWLARIVCYAFSLPPTAFTPQVNRATAETAQEAALEEGLAPLMGWVKRSSIVSSRGVWVIATSNLLGRMSDQRIRRTNP